VITGMSMVEGIGVGGFYGVGMEYTVGAGVGVFVGVQTRDYNAIFTQVSCSTSDR
jgi:hypothetical protein